MAISPVQRLAIKHLASGWSDERVASELKLSKGTVKKWRSYDPEFIKALDEAVLNHTQLVEAMLIEGERAAAQTLIDALKAETRGTPNWSVRLNAALSLLDRAGQRGRAVEKQQIAQVVARAQPDVEDALRRALRDPGVRSWLQTSQKGLAQLLPAHMGAETVEISVDFAPEDPTSAPVQLLPETPTNEKIA